MVSKNRCANSIYGLVLRWGVVFGVVLAGNLTLEAPPCAAQGPPAGRPPDDAVVVFDGRNTDGLVAHNGQPCRWPIEEGVLVAQTGGGVWTKLRFADAQVHAEFATPARGPGNSGLYFHGLWEMQIFNSHGSKSIDSHSAGAIYGIAAPLVNAAGLPETWQTYDVIFRAPRRDQGGKIIRPGTFTALLNGILVQDHTPFRDPVSSYTPLLTDKNPYVKELHAELMRSGKAPLHLQDHGAPVRFRNIWIRHLEPQN